VNAPRDRVIDALADLDRRVAARGVTIWIGAEPTFTRRESTDPWWLWQADPPAAPGNDKRARAAAVAAALAARTGASVAEVPGRTYPDEDAPRFCLAVGGVTVTPDPGVVEVNTAPCADLASFLVHLRDVYAAAAEAGLSPVRYRYNGDAVDSGGGGQITLGGPSAEASPFFAHPALLPRLVRYLNDHPALSYWFLGECAGSACQSPRADEGVRERWEELDLACAALERGAAPELLWSTLAPLLVDAAGNSHRAEINVEKLWNPHLPDRGKLGVVELRAFRMPPTPEQLAAAAALMRAVAARCALAPYDGPPIAWGLELHDRWALPWFLFQDLQAVFRDLDHHGLGLGAELELLAASYREPVVWRGEPAPGVTVTLSRALEFWPLIGDVASQERATSRLVDASAERLELTVELPAADAAPAVVAAGRPIPLGRARVVDGRATWLAGLRRRVFLPSPGLHPTVPAQDPLVLSLLGLELTFHGWRPGGGPYDGLPADAADAAARRAERLATGVVHHAGGASGVPAVAEWWTVDLRGAK
jgi:uncharacterized protein (DUF2126 family)